MRRAKNNRPPWCAAAGCFLPECFMLLFVQRGVSPAYEEASVNISMSFPENCRLGVILLIA
jgi:hypothetical protein